MALKIDFEKAYDRLEWNFIFVVFEALGFNVVWINWLKLCVASVNYQVLTNGAPSQPFSPTRGIRQGYPLSPYIFITFLEDLSRLIHKGIEHKLISGFKICRGAPLVSHSFYADDSLIFLKAKIRNVNGICKILDNFSLWSGQLVSSSKSVVVFSNNLPKRLARHLCRGFHMKFGRDVLIKVVLDPSLNHLMCTLKIPKFILTEVDRLRKNFLWQDRGGKPKLHAKYFRHTSFWEASKPSRASWSWRSILQGKEIIKAGLKWDIGNGEQVDLWRDVWCSDKPMLQLIDIVDTTYPPMKVSALIDPDTHAWNISSIEHVVPAQLLDQIRAIPLAEVNTSPDFRVWPHSKDGLTFSLLAYGALGTTFFFPQKYFDWKAVTVNAYNAAAEYVKVLSLAPKSENKFICHIHWIPPDNCFVKLNVDGASGDAGKAGVGGVLRAADGQFLAAFAKHIYDKSNNVAELWAIRDGMKLVVQLGVPKDIRALSLHFDQVVFQHHHKEGNFAADVLAKKAAYDALPGVWFDVPPSFLYTVLYDDIMGRAFPGL
ncbi:uncharacterized protein LOC113311739 [Papaver somniferum]|uniref:uncharacterized protein LOC113311739 n=1 Tax=Papaver somniferum TaxID=3469 RepID=UPI000E6F6956|nr:uncharacterized protein LOC113311739 [Papaver somniferum]